MEIKENNEYPTKIKRPTAEEMLLKEILGEDEYKKLKEKRDKNE